TKLGQAAAFRGRRKMERISFRTGKLVACRFFLPALLAVSLGGFETVCAPRACAQQAFPLGRGGRVIVGGEDGSTTEQASSALLPVDRETTRQWERAQKLIGDGRYSDGITLLDEILQ